MTSFLISYPDMPVSALHYWTGLPMDPDYPVENYFTGERSAYGQLASQTSIGINFFFDLGPGVTKTYDHLIIGGCNILKAEGLYSVRARARVTLASSSINHLGTLNQFQNKTFAGPHGHDILFTSSFNSDVGPASGTYRYWTIYFEGANSKAACSKFHLGNWLDFGKEPDSYEHSVIDPGLSTWQFPRGQRTMDRLTHEVHRVAVEYDGLTDAQVVDVSEKLLKDPYRHTFFLHAATYTEVLFGNSLLHVRIIADECSINRVYNDWNNVRLVFEEMI
jgi:hypothetical protein